MQSTRVLIVEDEEVLLRLYEKTLSHAGFQTYRATILEQAFQLILSFDPDVVCMDWQLGSEISAPLLDFYAAVDPACAPQIVVVTGQSHNLDLSAYAGLVKAVVGKPISIHELTRMVKILAEQTRERLPLYEVEIQTLGHGVKWLTWSGRLSLCVFAEVVCGNLMDAETVIMDFGRLSSNLHDLQEIERMVISRLPEWQAVYVINEPPYEPLIKYLMPYFSAAPHIVYNLTLNQVWDKIAC